MGVIKMGENYLSFLKNYACSIVNEARVMRKTLRRKKHFTGTEKRSGTLLGRSLYGMVQKKMGQR